jgi:predicted phage terminase large subunit-like protein
VPSREDEIEEIEILEELEARKARANFLEFIKQTKTNYEVNWHHVAEAETLDAFVRGEIPRLIILAPPRTGKSEQVSRRLPPYILGKFPDAEIIGASYSAELASAMNRDVQDIMASHDYKKIFPLTRIKEKGADNDTAKKTSTYFEVVGHKGSLHSVGVGGGVTGTGGDFIIVDDPIKNQEEADSVTIRNKIDNWYKSTLYTRLEKGAKICITMTPWHEDDLVHRLLQLAKADPESEQWTVLRLTMIKEAEETHPLDTRALGEPLWPNKYDAETCKKMRKTTGTRVWNALYQCRPTAMEGSIIKRKYIKFYRMEDLPPRFDLELLSLDCSFTGTATSDYVSITAWGRDGANKYLLPREVHDRLDLPGTIKELLKMCSAFPRAYMKLVENKANGPAVIQTLQKDVAGLIAVEPHGTKEARLNSVSPDFEAGNVWFPHPDIAPWVHDFIEELVNFPNQKADDRVDSTSQALIRLRESSSFSENLVPNRIRSLVSDLSGGEAW